MCSSLHGEAVLEAESTRLSIRLQWEFPTREWQNPISLPNQSKHTMTTPWNLLKALKFKPVLYFGLPTTSLNNLWLDLTGFKVPELQHTLNLGIYMFPRLQLIILEHNLNSSHMQSSLSHWLFSYWMLFSCLLLQSVLYKVLNKCDLTTTSAWSSLALYIKLKFSLCIFIQ